MRYYLEFEKPIEELELKIEELKSLSNRKDMDITSAVKSLRKRQKNSALKSFPISHRGRKLFLQGILTGRIHLTI